MVPVKKTPSSKAKTRPPALVKKPYSSRLSSIASTGSDKGKGSKVQTKIESDGDDKKLHASTVLVERNSKGTDKIKTRRTHSTDQHEDVTPTNRSPNGHAATSSRGTGGHNSPTETRSVTRQRTIVEYISIKSRQPPKQASAAPHNNKTEATNSSLVDDFLTPNGEGDDSLQYDDAAPSPTNTRNGTADKYSDLHPTSGGAATANTTTTVTRSTSANGHASSRRHKDKKSTRLQDSITRLIQKCNADVLHLDKKIQMLESQYFKQPAETTALIKGYESSAGASMAVGYMLPNQKSRKLAQQKLRTIQNTSQALITEHIFSLTSSTCAASKELLNN